MAKVLGLGGVFFKAKDPAALTAWYQRVLGFPASDYGVMFPHPEVGFTLWSPFKADTTYFEPSTNPYMINFLVDDIDGVIAAAAEQGVEPTGRQDESYGRFAWFVDPEGAKVEIWQPLEEASG
ncbi:MAG: glyoxalase [Caulobacterales bacterium 68-7]|nr:VOC family protein [Caulobacterales bacterium]OJU08566.1 MAG: glyoxalase [Caulobacterales bacterium 68-7]